MTIRDKSVHDDLTIDLTGPDGNAFILLGLAARFAKQLGRDPNAVQRLMIAGDYEHLVNVFDDQFGNFVTLLR